MPINTSSAQSFLFLIVLYAQNVEESLQVKYKINSKCCYKYEVTLQRK